MNDKEKTRQLLDDLTEEFECRSVKLEWEPTKDNRGLYRSYTQTIHMNEDSWRGWEPAGLHEFAHHLTRMRGFSGHGQQFVDSLTEITKAQYGDRWVQEYPWESEYTKVIRHAGDEVREKFRASSKYACKGRTNDGHACVNKGWYLPTDYIVGARPGEFGDARFCQIHLNKLRRNLNGKRDDSNQDAHDREHGLCKGTTSQGNPCWQKANTGYRNVNNVPQISRGRCRFHREWEEFGIKHVEINTLEQDEEDLRRA